MILTNQFAVLRIKIRNWLVKRRRKRNNIKAAKRGISVWM